MTPVHGDSVQRFALIPISCLSMSHAHNDTRASHSLVLQNFYSVSLRIHVYALYYQNWRNINIVLPINGIVTIHSKIFVRLQIYEFILKKDLLDKGWDNTKHSVLFRLLFTLNMFPHHFSAVLHFIPQFNLFLNLFAFSISK